MTAAELAQAIVEIRTERFSSLTEERASNHVGSQPIATHVRDFDLQYADALLNRVYANKKRRDG